MTRLVLEAIQSGKNPQVLVDLHRVCGEEAESKWVPETPQEIAGRIFCVSNSPSMKKRIIEVTLTYLRFTDCLHGNGQEQFTTNSQESCRSCEGYWCKPLGFWVRTSLTSLTMNEPLTHIRSIDAVYDAQVSSSSSAQRDIERKSTYHRSCRLHCLLRPLVSSPNSRCMVAQRCQISLCSKRPISSEIRFTYILPRNIQARLRMASGSLFGSSCSLSNQICRLMRIHWHNFSLKSMVAAKVLLEVCWYLEVLMSMRHFEAILRMLNASVTWVKPQTDWITRKYDCSSAEYVSHPQYINR